MNQIKRFLFKNIDIKAQYLSVGSVWKKIIKGRGYNQITQKMLGEICSLGIILANGMKHNGKIILQIQGTGKVSLLFVEVDNKLNIRGFARENGKIIDGNLIDILGDTQIVITLYNSQTKSNFQSIIPLNKNGLIDTFEDYFTNSDQIDSKFLITTNNDNLSAILIQKLPKSGNKTKEQSFDDWERVNILLTTITDKELQTLALEELLLRVFSEDDIEVFDGSLIEYQCQLNLDKFAKIIIDMGEDEARKILSENGVIAINNEICNENIVFSKNDVEKIFIKD